MNETVDPLRQPIFYGMVCLFAIKSGVHMALHIFQINILYGVLIGLVMASGLIFFFRKLFAIAAESDSRAVVRYIESLSERRRSKSPIKADRSNPWYVGLNDDRSNTEDL
jgi:hypothetical protein